MSSVGSNSDDESSQDGEQIRVVLALASECSDRSLEVPREPIAVPTDTGRKGLSAVVNHLLDRKLDEDSDEDGDDRLSAIPFDFLVGKGSQRLLRTGVEREARRSGLTLEEAIFITYFPAQRPLELQGESKELPDWISAMTFVREGNFLFAGCYDGSLSVYQQPAALKNDDAALKKMSTHTTSNRGPIKCLATALAPDNTWVATGSMDHSLELVEMDRDTFKMKLYANCVGGHASAIGSVDICHGAQQYLASGDWDGGLCIFDYLEDPSNVEQPIKKTKTGKHTSSHEEARRPTLAPKMSIQAHSSKISGVSWGNFEKVSQGSSFEARTLTTGSWDHSLKVWDIERKECLQTLNGSRVISCLDTSHHSAGIVATGHPDCTIRLWDTRTDDDTKESSLMTVNNTFRPSHKEWISAVQWSRDNAYHLSSTSHDGTVKLWDIRSPLPLYTMRAFPKKQKGLSLTYGNGEDGVMFAGGTDCVLKQFRCK